MTDTTKVKEELDKVLDNFADAIQSGDMILDVKEMETIPQILTLIDKYTRESRLDEVDGLRREFWRTTWEPYDPDSVFADRIAQLTEQKDGE